MASLSPEEQVAEFNRREEIKRRKQLVDQKWHRVREDARAKFADQLDNQHDLIAEQRDEIEKYERKIAELEKDLRQARERAMLTHAEWREEHERQEKANRAHLEDRAKAEKAERAEKAKARGPKPLNRVILDVHATVAPDAQGPSRRPRTGTAPAPRGAATSSRSRTATLGQNLRLRFEYVVRAGHPADIRRALEKCMADAGATQVREPIDLIERTKLPDVETSGG